MKEAEDLSKKVYTPEPPLKGIWYLAVFYLFNNTIHAVPYETKEAASQAIKDFIAKRPNNFVKNSYIIKRNYDKYPNGEVI